MQSLIVNAMSSCGPKGKAGLLLNVLAEFDPGDGADCAGGGVGGVLGEAGAEGGQL